MPHLLEMLVQCTCAARRLGQRASRLPKARHAAPDTRDGSATCYGGGERRRTGEVADELKHPHQPRRVRNRAHETLGLGEDVEHNHGLRGLPASSCPLIMLPAPLFLTECWARSQVGIGIGYESRQHVRVKLEGQG